MHLQVLIPVDEFAPCLWRAEVTGEQSLKILTFRTHQPWGRGDPGLGEEGAGVQKWEDVGEAEEEYVQITGHILFQAKAYLQTEVFCLFIGQFFQW